MTLLCPAKPRPHSHAYGHWICGRRRFHLGRHRYRNYTWPRLRRWQLRYEP